MMTQTNSFMFYQDRDVQAIELPYKNDSMSAIIIMPYTNTNIESFSNLNNLNDLSIKNILDGMEENVVKLNLPKFEVEFYMKLKHVLQSLGMVFPF
jgi:serpin B